LLDSAIVNDGSVRPSVCLSHSWATPKRFKDRNAFYITRERCF